MAIILEGEEISSEKVNEILGPDKSAKVGVVAKKRKRPRSTLQRIFAIPVEQLDSQHGLRLLKQFLRERTIIAPMSRMFQENAKDVPASVPDFVRELTERNRSIDQIQLGRSLTLAGGLDEFEQYRKQFLGKEFLGLRTGMEEFDRCTLGMRGTMIIGARPNVGKTALALHLGLSTLQQTENTKVALLFISLDMNRAELESRILAHLSDVDVRYVLMENFPAPLSEQGKWKKAIKTSLKCMGADLGRRIAIVDQTDLGGEVTAERLAALIERTKKDAAATSVLTVIDYLQLFDVPELVAKQGDLAADKYRVQLLQRTRELTGSVDNPKGEPLLVISEARKPSSSKEAWGSGLSELMGSARLAYAADAVLSIRDMELAEVQTAYTIGTEDAARARLDRMQDSGTAPLVLKLEKGRDGMSRGAWGAEFAFRTYRFKEVPLVPRPTAQDEPETNRNQPRSRQRTNRRRGRPA